jgi:transposase
MIFAGIDWGEARHRVVLLDEQGQILGREWIDHEQDHLAHLDDLLAQGDVRQNVHVAIELHDSLLLDRLLRLGVKVYGLNPKSAQRARERFTPTGIKDDDRDAWSLAEFVRTSHQHLRPIQPDSEATIALQEWVSLREDLVAQRTVHLQQLRAHLVRWHPHVFKGFTDLNRQWVLDLLEAYPTADAFAALSHKQVMAWTRGRRLKLVTRHRVADAAVMASPTSQSARNAAHTVEVCHHVEAIRLLNQRLDDVEKAMEHNIAQHPDAIIFQSLPNTGTATVAAMLASFGEDRQRWQGYQELAARWGTAPITIQSGKYHAVRRRKACDHTIHQAWMWFAFNTIRKEGCWAREDYRAKRQAGSAHYATLRIIANRWVKIATSCWKERNPYDEAIHQERRAERKKPRLDK